MELNLNQLGIATFEVKAGIEKDVTRSLNHVSFPEFQQAILEILVGSLNLPTRKTEAGIVPDYEDPKIIELEECLRKNKKVLADLFWRNIYE